jgi:hypothetical protein
VGQVCTVRWECLDGGGNVEQYGRALGMARLNPWDEGRMAWTEIVFERGSARTPGKIELGRPQPRGDGVVAVEVSFEGADIGPLLGTEMTNALGLTRAISHPF